MHRIFLALSALLCLSACASQSLADLKHATPPEDRYLAALAHGYQEYAEEKTAAYEWDVADYFATKGLQATQGAELQPEDPAAWNIPAVGMNDFTDARNQLVAAIATARTTQPEEAAAAALAYDRWVVLGARGQDAVKIQEARERFFTLLGKLSEQATAAPQTSSTVLYFPFDKATLSGSASIALKQLVDYVKSAGDINIIINGHADRAGSEEYNMKLSENRALFVRDALLYVGVPEKQIQWYAFGESDPDVPTADGVAEPLNRRVEIFIE
jgi:outer membrane protein OmpA-like peptidoglycan-associated protein